MTEAAVGSVTQTQTCGALIERQTVGVDIERDRRPIHTRISAEERRGSGCMQTGFRRDPL